MSRTSIRLVGFAALGLIVNGISGVSALPINTTPIGAASAASSPVIDAAYEYYVQDGRCYMRARTYPRPVNMSKCGVLQRHPALH